MNISMIHVIFEIYMNINVKFLQNEKIFLCPFNVINFNK